MVLRRPRTGTAVVGVAVTVFAVWMVAGLGGAAAASDIGTVLMTVTAGIVCLRRAARQRGRMGLAWGCIGLGSLSYAVGEACWSWIELVQDAKVPFPGLPDVGYL